MDKQINGSRAANAPGLARNAQRPLLAARLGEKRALFDLKTDDDLFNGQEDDDARTIVEEMPKGQAKNRNSRGSRGSRGSTTDRAIRGNARKERIKVGNDVIEIDLSSFDSSSGEESEGDNDNDDDGEDIIEEAARNAQSGISSDSNDREIPI